MQSGDLKSFPILMDFIHKSFKKKNYNTNIPQCEFFKCGCEGKTIGSVEVPKLRLKA